jgi:hypothetical protein
VALVDLDKDEPSLCYSSRNTSDEKALEKALGSTLSIKHILTGQGGCR